jgi:ATP-binding cassette subfamily B protein
MSALQSLGSLIDAFRPADGPPPQRLWPFMHWSLKGSWPMLWVAGLLSGIAGATEVVSALILGWVVDAAVSSLSLIHI